MKHYQNLDEIQNIEFTRDDIFSKEENIKITGNLFVLTGTFTTGKREDIKKIIELAGGIVSKNLTLSIDYLVVGDIVSRDWKYGKYGSKIEKALKSNIKIISEHTLIKNINSENDLKKEDIEKELFDIFLSIKPSPKQEIYIKINFDGKIEFITKEVTEVNMKNILSNLSKNIRNINFVRFYYEQLENKEKYKQSIINSLIKSINTFFKENKDYITTPKTLTTKKRRYEKVISEIEEIIPKFKNSKFIQIKLDELKNEIK